MPPPPRAHPQAPSPPLRGHSQGQDRPRTHKATLSHVCLESFSGPSGPSLRANTRPIQARSYPQWIRSQWDHSCPQTPAHTRVAPLAVHSQPLSLQHSHRSGSSAAPGRTLDSQHYRPISRPRLQMVFLFTIEHLFIHQMH